MEVMTAPASQSQRLKRLAVSLQSLASELAAGKAVNARAEAGKAASDEVITEAPDA